MCIKNSDFLHNSTAQLILGSAKSTDLTILSCGKFGSLSYRNEIALYFATFSYTCRYRAIKSEFLGVNWQV